jgi:hypothetical protein
MFLSTLRLLPTFLSFFLLSSTFANTQQDVKDSLVNPFALKYADFFSGLSYSTIGYRDFATSPLFYRGPALELSIGWPVMKAKSYREFGMNALAGLTDASVPDNSEFEVKTPARFFSGNVNYNYLRKTEFLSPKYLLYLGLSAVSRFHFRINPALGNNGTGVEAFFNFMASGRIEKDFSKKSGEGKAWLVFRRKNETNRTLAFQLNIGLLNFNYRPGYAYSGFSEFDGTNTNGLQFILNEHSWSLNGMRFQSRLEWIINKRKKYSNRWVYSWELITAPGKYEEFQFVAHSFTYSVLLFRK